MFQIVTGMYFRPVALTETLHRQVFYTNLRAFRAQGLEFVFGKLLISTGGNGASTMTVETTERLEVVMPGGRREALTLRGDGEDSSGRKPQRILPERRWAGSAAATTC